ncbi:MAG: SMI1/KNR4 family protein [Planctomycetaceae bacterium]|nr:SMI1/KNR4 family protein [Planctomycetaceae bacterium]
MPPNQWQQFLNRLSRDLLADPELSEQLPDEVFDSGWLGFSPATENEIQATENRLGKKLPPSLRSFYEVTNGWRCVGCFIWNILPVGEVGWLPETVPHLFKIAQDVEETKGPFEKDPGGRRLRDHRNEQGTRVKRSLVITSEGDASHWLLDPETINTKGEWAGGRWSSWNPAMSWNADSFADLVRDEYETFLKLTADRQDS